MFFNLNFSKKIIPLLLILLSLVLSLVIAELVTKFIYKNQLGINTDERSIFYRYDENLGWFPIAGSEGIYNVNRSVKIKHNSKGFRDSEHLVNGKPSIVFSGDSFVWGFDVEETERFTEKIQQALPGWNIYNFGVSGYGTDQEYLLLKSQWDFYRPKIFFLVFCTDNDEDDNSSNMRYGGYFKPYFIVKGNDLELKGVPVPRTENFFFGAHKILSKSYLVRLIVKAYFKRYGAPVVLVPNPTQAIIVKMNKFVRDKGSVFIVGLETRHPILEKFFESEKIPYVNLENPYRYPVFGHWTPEGHRYVSKKILEFLIQNKFIVGNPNPSSY